jgi:hypothetical protein
VEIWTACGPVEHCVDCLRSFIDAGDNLNEQFQIFLRELLAAVDSDGRRPLASNEQVERQVRTLGAAIGDCNPDAKRRAANQN